MNTLRANLLTLSIGLAVAGMSQFAQAASDTWDDEAADNNWQTTINWVLNGTSFPGSITAGTYASTEDATFSMAGSGTINLGEFINIRTILFGVSGGDAGAFTIGDANDTLHLSNNGGITINVGVTTAQNIGLSGTIINTSTTGGAVTTFTNNGSGLLTIAGNLVANAASGNGRFTFAGTGNTTVTGTITEVGAGNNALFKQGAGTLTLSNGSVWNGSGAVQTAFSGPFTTQEGILLLNGGTHTVTGEAVIGGVVTHGGAGQNAKIQVDSGALNISSWLSIGRGNGVGGVSSDIELNNNAVVTALDMSAGFNAGNAGNLPKGTITLNGTSILSVSNTVNFAESAGSNFTMNINDSATFRQTANVAQTKVGMNNGAVGVINVNGGTATFHRDFILGAGGTGSGKLVLNSGTVNVATTVERWLKLNDSGSASTGQIDVNGGNLNLNTNTDLRFSTNGSASGTNVVNLNGGAITGHTGNANGVFSGGSVVDLNQGSNQAGVNNTFNLNGGTLTIGQIITTNNAGNAAFNFNGGTLRAAAASTAFLDLGGANQRANVRDGGAIIDTNGVNVTVVQALLHSNIGGDNATDGGLTKQGTGTLTLAGANTYSGATTVSGGTLDLTGSLMDTAITVNGSAVFTESSAGVIGGTSSITHNSSATTTSLAGTNTYTGATAVNAGMLSLTGSLTGTAITVSGSAVFSESSTGAVGGAGSFTHSSSGTSTLAGTNTYSGATTVSNGTLILSGTGAINSSSGITINGSGAKFLQTSTVAGTVAVALTQGTLDGTGTVGAVTVGNGTGGIVTNGNGTTATLTLGSVILNGAATLIFRKVDDTSTAALAITGALATTPANGLVTLNVLTPPVWNNGSTYNLISYGSFGGANTDFALGTITGLGARQSATIGNTGATSGFITLAIAGDTPVWTGLVSGAWTTTAIGGSQNWKLQTAGTGTEFLTNDQVIFDDTAAGTTAVTINDATVSPASTVFNNSTKNYTLSGSNGITSGTLAKSGTGTVTISTANTYAGATNINGGTLIAGNGAALGSVAAGTTVASGATLDINSQNLSTEVLTISGSGVSGNGALVNNGGSDQIDATGRIVLAADATIGGTRRWDLRNSTPTLNMGGFTLTKTGTNLVSLVGVGVSNAGHIVINQGRLNIETTTNLGGSSANTITVNSGGTLGFWSSTVAVGWSVALSEATILQENGSSTISGPVALTGANTINVAGTSHTISGEISGAGSLTKTGGGVLTLRHTNSYGGGTVVSAGRLAYDAGGTAGPTGNITPFGTGSVTVNSGAQLRLGTNVGGHNNSVFNIANAVTLDGGTIFAEGGIQHLTGTVAVGASGGTLGATFNGAGFDINKGLFLDGVVSGSGNLTLQQSGISTGNNYNTSIVYFANNGNTYSGTITVTPMGAGNGGGSYLGVNATSALANATVNLSGNNTSNAQQFGTSPIVFNTGLGTATLGALSGSGNVVLTGYNQSTHAYGADSIALNVGGNDADTTYSGVISGGGSVTKSGAGTMTVSGISTYTGATTVSAGTLEVTGQLSGTSSSTVSGGTLLANNTTGSATGSGNVTVQSGARLGGSGLVGLVTGTQNITVNNGGILGIGNMSDIVGEDLDLVTSGVGVIMFNGTLEFDIYDNFGGTSNLTNPLDTNDLLNLTSATSIVLSGTLKVTDLTGLSETSWVEGDIWRLLDWSNVTAGPKFSGGFTTLDLPDLDAGLDWLASTDGSGFYISVIVVPEPSRAVLLLAGFMVLVLRRRPLVNG